MGTRLPSLAPPGPREVLHSPGMPSQNREGEQGGCVRGRDPGAGLVGGLCCEALEPWILTTAEQLAKAPLGEAPGVTAMDPEGGRVLGAGTEKAQAEDRAMRARMRWDGHCQ